MMRMALGLIATFFIGGLLGCSSTTGGREGVGVVIAHRGASGYLPEHTLAAYALAVGQGAAIIEPDVVLTKDGVLICSHDLTLDAATNVEEVYQGRAREDGKHYAIDFTLAEIRMLMVDDKERYTAPPQQREGYHVATLDEMLALVERLAERTGRRIGVIPEPKSPSFHLEEGQPIECPLIEAMRSRGYLTTHGVHLADGPGIVQCFDLESVERFARLGVLPSDLIWLVGADYPTEDELDRAAAVTHGIGPSRKLVDGPDGRDFLRSVRVRGLVLYPYTFRNEPTDLERYFSMPEVAGVFADFPDVARRARERVMERKYGQPSEPRGTIRIEGGF
ncbi:MAG: glycerophosphodiester phosphodiesterase family protein [Planctomycetota bacterium]